MKRRTLLLSFASLSGSVAAGALTIPQISTHPVVADTPSIGTPSNQRLSTFIEFTFDRFSVEGQSLPSDGTIEVIYRLVEDGSNTSVSGNPPKQSLAYSGSNTTVGTSEQILRVRSTDIRLGLNHRLQTEFRVLDSTVQNSFQQ